uniref:Sodium/nucleoside cotransporter n=1 Tax=Otus sunia TaxID=257818 RepID=A0A8C8BRU0_9STRI
MGWVGLGWVGLIRIHHLHHSLEGLSPVSLAAGVVLPKSSSHTDGNLKGGQGRTFGGNEPHCWPWLVLRIHDPMGHVFLTHNVPSPAYLCYFIAACWLNFQRALALVVITAVVVFFVCWSLFKKYCGAKVLLCSPHGDICSVTVWDFLCRLLVVGHVVGLIPWLILDSSRNPEQLISLAGFFFLVLFLFACSKHHGAVYWRAIFLGLGLEFLFGLIVLRTTPGNQAFQWLGDQFFLGYTTAGSSFVFGNTLIEEVFAFQTLPIVVFFSCVMSILYYLGVMQWLIVKISWLLQVSMGTTPAETLSVAGNIFVGQTEAPLLVRPYLADMTRSEIHAVMTGGFSTIAGSVMGAYISFGIDAASLIAASVMAAPCALAMSKLVYPEVEESKFKDKAKRNILEAASNGAAASVGLVANIAANLIAFLAMLEFINAALRWFGEMVDIEGWPALTSWADSPLVAELLGIKIFLNEFVAYQQLATYKKNRLSGLEEWDGSRKQWISVRGTCIATFALCGFANLSSIGIMLGGLASMVPERKGDLASIVLRALLTGICVSMLNACLAGRSLPHTSGARKKWGETGEGVQCLTQCCGHYNHTSCTGTT